MSIIPHTFLPRSMFDMDSWFRPVNQTFPFNTPTTSTLDIFDPFDDLDRMMGRNLMWLNKPDFIDFAPVKQTKVPKKWRIKLDCRGYNPQSVKTDIKDNKLVVYGCEGDSTKKDHGDYTVKEFRKTYNFPEDVESDKMVSFMTPQGYLIIEMPLKHIESKHGKNEFLFPQIVDTKNGMQQVNWNLTLPKTIDPTKVHVTMKDRDLIVKAENKEEKPDNYSQTYFYQRTTLPENTDFNQLKVQFDNNHQLSVTAPLYKELKDTFGRTIPIEFQTPQQQQMQQKQFR